MNQRGAGRALALGALVAFHAARVVVLGLALRPGELHAEDAAVALVPHLEVVEEAPRDARAAGGVRSDPVEVRGDELLLGLTPHRCSRANEHRADQYFFQIHGVTPAASKRGPRRLKPALKHCRPILRACESSSWKTTR